MTIDLGRKSMWLLASQQELPINSTVVLTNQSIKQVSNHSTDQLMIYYQLTSKDHTKGNEDNSKMGNTVYIHI